MPYSDLTSFQFERGKGFTEDSVLAFRVLALNVIDDLIRGEALTVANFPLSQDEITLVLNHRSHDRVSYGSPKGPTLRQTTSADSAPMTPVEQMPTTAPAPTPPPVMSQLPPEPIATPTPTPRVPAEEDEFAIASRWLAMATRTASGRSS
jgi:hypothetical protein